MKPTSQISSKQSDQRSFPLTDYQFQSTLEAPGVTPKATRQLRTLWKLSAEFLGAEANRSYLPELLLFIVIAALSAWPIISTIIAITRMVRNY